MLMLSYGLSTVFFFSSRRRHTRFDCDWSSDVCSSDLLPGRRGQLPAGGHVDPGGGHPGPPGHRDRQGAARGQIGRASCRERVEISVVAVSLKKKKQPQRHLSEKCGEGHCKHWYKHSTV